jgi:hypothetical protein
MGRRVKRREGESEADYQSRVEAKRQRGLQLAKEWRAKRKEEKLASPEYQEWRRLVEKRRDPTFRREEARLHALQTRAVPSWHDGTCDICGATPPPKKNGARGLCQDHRHDTNEIRGYLCNGCNIKVGVLDLRFTDSDLYAKLQAYSLRGAPVVPVRSEAPKRRRASAGQPRLFGGGE